VVQETALGVMSRASASGASPSWHSEFRASLGWAPASSALNDCHRAQVFHARAREQITCRPLRWPAAGMGARLASGPRSPCHPCAELCQAGPAAPRRMSEVSAALTWIGLHLLDQAPASGGTWKRIRALGAGSVASKFQLTGDRIFVDENPLQDVQRISVVTASLSSDAPPIRLLQRAAHPNYNFIDHLWIGTAKTFFWSNGNTIYAHAITSSP
jgi:hypothetical protein